MATQTMSMCSRHDSEEVRFYCNDCKALICDDCVIGDHKNHKTMKLKEFGASRRSSLLKFPQVSEKGTIPKIKGAVKQAIEKRSKFSEAIAREIDSVKTKRKLLDSILDELEEEIIAGFVKEEEDASKLYEIFINNQETKVERIKTIVSEINSKGNEILDTEIAKYDVALEGILKHDPYLDVIPTKQIPRHDFDDEYVRKSGKKELRRFIGFVECGTYEDLPIQVAPEIPTTPKPEIAKKESGKKELRRLTGFVECGTYEDMPIQVAPEIPTTPKPEIAKKESGKKERRRLIGSVECGTYEDLLPMQIAPEIPTTPKPEIAKKESLRPEMNPYLEPVPSKPPEYTEIENHTCFQTLKSFEIENSIGHIVPKEEGRFKAWIIERHITEIDCSGKLDNNLLKVLEQNPMSTCSNQNNELLIALKGKSSIKVLKSNKKSTGLENSFSVSSGKHKFACMCISRTCAHENIVCFQEKAKPENYILRRYVNGKHTNCDLKLLSGIAEVENPVQICQNSAGDICMTCRPDKKSSWVTVVDHTGTRKFSFPTNDSASKEQFDFVGAVCLGKFISISDRKNCEQLLVSLTGKCVLKNKLDGKPLCCSVDQLENVWIGFDNGKVQVVSYKSENDYAEVKVYEPNANTHF